jgi:hypothetical protein
MKPIDGVERGGLNHIRSRSQAAAGDLLQDAPRLPGGGVGDFQLHERFEQLRVFALDDGELLRRAFGDRQHFAGRDGRTEERRHPLQVAAPFADFDQLDQVIQMHDAPRLRHLVEQLLAALLPHAETGHPRDDPRAARGP